MLIRLADSTTRKWENPLTLVRRVAVALTWASSMRDNWLVEMVDLISFKGVWDTLMKPLVALTCAMALAVSPMVFAWPGYVSQIPNGYVNRCANCHIDINGGGNRNPFGLAFAAEGNTWTAALASADTDGDGFTNGAELQDPLGEWMFGELDPGDPLLISGAGWDFSTPGERALQLSEILLEPETGQGNYQIIEITNPLVDTIDAGGLYLVTSGGFFQIPSAEAVNTEIPGNGTLKIVINSDDPDEPGVVSEPASGGFEALQTNSDFVALHWISDPMMNFDVSWGLVDYAQWLRVPEGQSVATGAQQWVTGTYVTAPVVGTSMIYDGSGNTADDWITNQVPTLDVFQIGRLVRGLLGIIPAEPSPEFNDNADHLINSGDLVTRINASHGSP